MALLDVEFLLDPPAKLDRPIVYRLRSGILRPAVLRQLNALAEASGLEPDDCSSRDLPGRAFASVLFGEPLLICDATKEEKGEREELGVLLRVVADQGCATTVLILSGQWSAHLDPSWSFVEERCLVLDEPWVTAAVLPVALRYFITVTDLVAGATLRTQPAFIASFDAFPGPKGRGLPELLQEFESRVVTQTEIGTGIYDGLAEVFDEVDEEQRSSRRRHMRTFIETKDAWSLVKLVADSDRRFWIDGVTSNGLIAEFYRSTAVLLAGAMGSSAPEKSGKRRSTQRVELLDAVIWAVLLLAYERRLAFRKVIAGVPRYVVSENHLLAGPIALVLDTIGREYIARSAKAPGPCLDGLWPSVRSVLTDPCDVHDPLEVARQGFLLALRKALETNSVVDEPSCFGRLRRTLANGLLPSVSA